MKSFPILSSLTLLLFAILLASCVKEPDFMTQQYEAQEFFGEDYLQNYTTPEIMFHFVSVHEGWGTVEGILINNKGTILKYTLDELAFDLEPEIANLEKIREVIASSAEQSKVDVHDLVENFKKVRNIDRNNLQLDQSKPSDVYTHYLMAYDLYYGDGACAGGSCPGAEPSEVSLSQYILQAEGYLNGGNSSVQARQIVDWMEELRSGF